MIKEKLRQFCFLGFLILADKKSEVLAAKRNQRRLIIRFGTTVLFAN